MTDAALPPVPPCRQAIATAAIARGDSSPWAVSREQQDGRHGVRRAEDDVKGGVALDGQFQVAFFGDLV
jgi:hypothetical protein